MVPIKKLRIALNIALLVTVVMILGFIFSSDNQNISLEGLSFSELSEYFETTAQSKGAVVAFSILKTVPLSHNIDVHLLGHVFGDELYQQEGIGGIGKCTRDFRNACSHSLVVGGLLENGFQVLPEIADACQKAPGGSGAYTMCFHGFGHGVLAFSDYELPEAITLCEQVGTKKYRNREYVECVGGTIMEMIGGVHDPQTRSEKSEIYFKETDPLYPCSSDFMPDFVRSICYTYVTPHLFEAAGGNLGNPTAEDFEKAFRFCDILDTADRIDRDACYGGFGKEFVVLVQDRDIRIIEDTNDIQLKKVFDWCTLAHNKSDVEACLRDALFSLYWGGENDRGTALRFCDSMSGTEYQNMCFNALIGSVSYYIDDQIYRSDFCRELPHVYREQCIRSLNVE